MSLSCKRCFFPAEFADQCVHLPSADFWAGTYALGNLPNQTSQMSVHICTMFIFAGKQEVKDTHHNVSEWCLDASKPDSTL